MNKQDITEIIKDEREKCYKEYEKLEDGKLSWENVAAKNEVVGRLLMLNKIHARINELE